MKKIKLSLFMAIVVTSSIVAQKSISVEVNKQEIALNSTDQAYVSSLDANKKQITKPSKVKADKVVTMYPNPANDIVTLQGVKVDDEIAISNIKGKIMMELKAKAQEEIILIESLPSGIYMLSINGENRKLVVQ